MKKRIIYWLGGAAVFFVLVILSWMTVETGIEVSSRATFCGACHAMEPMVNSYRDNTHGGNNPRGITAACTDCHVSHENLLAHFVGKARSGTHDIWVTVTRDEMAIDWQAKRAEHNEYVYDSGCLTCHQELEKATQDKGQHENYFVGITDSQCVDCHAEIGHSNLNMYLLETKYQYGD
ncbi:MAG: NapC/NirT family cytochrome c [Anaerolineales bacterium]|nr:NapC/NirT family cytochrome c [Anaerolineales bacterium]